jgi:hypothetical protein
MQLVLECVTMTMTTIDNAVNKIRNLTRLIWIDFVSMYVLQLCTSFLMKSHLLTSAFNMSDSETS